MNKLLLLSAIFSLGMLSCSNLDVTDPDELALQWKTNSSESLSSGASSSSTASSSSNVSSSAVSSSSQAISSSEDKSSSSSYVAPAYGNLTDNRGGVTRNYLTIKIGSKTWMAENLNYGERVDLGISQTGVQKYCDGDNDLGCSNGKGGLYQWHTAMDLPDSCLTSNCEVSVQEPMQGICPTSWHLPTLIEIDSVIEIFGGEELASAYLKYDSTGWDWDYNFNEGNPSRFRAIPAGFVLSTQAALSYSVSSVEVTAAWWMAQQLSAVQGKSWYFQAGSSYVNRNTSFDKPAAFSIRCVKD